MKKALFGVLFLALALSSLSAASEKFDINSIPDYQDGKWNFVDETPLMVTLGSANHVWGKARKYRLKANPGIAGFEWAAFNEEEPFFKRWGIETERRSALAIKDRSGAWISGKLGEGRMEVRSEFDRNKKFIGVWATLFIQSLRVAAGHFYPSPGYNKTPAKASGSDI